MLQTKKIGDISNEQLDKIIEKHYSHWKRYSVNMKHEGVENNFKKIYAHINKIPGGIVLLDNNDIIGFCVFKKNNLKFYQEYDEPWIDDVMIFDKYRKMGYGTILIKEAKNYLKELGYNHAYLWTDKAPIFYEKIGFEYIQDIMKNDETGYARLYKIEF